MGSTADVTTVPILSAHPTICVSYCLLSYLCQRKGPHGPRNHFRIKSPHQPCRQYPSLTWASVSRCSLQGLPYGPPDPPRFHVNSLIHPTHLSVSGQVFAPGFTVWTPISTTIPCELTDTPDSPERQWAGVRFRVYRMDPRIHHDSMWTHWYTRLTWASVGRCSLQGLPYGPPDPPRFHVNSLIHPSLPSSKVQSRMNMNLYLWIKGKAKLLCTCTEHWRINNPLL